MASTTRTWQGASVPIAQISTIQVTSFAQNETFILTMEHPSGVSGEDITIVSYTAGAGETATTVANAIYLLATTGSESSSGSGTGAWTHEYAKAVSFQQSTDTITMTSRFPGRPILFAMSGTGTTTTATTRPNIGPHCWDVPGNWLEGKVPIDDDDVIIMGDTPSILYGLSQGGVTLDTMYIHDYTGNIGPSPYLPLIVDTTDEVTVHGSGDIHLRWHDPTSVALVRVEAVGLMTISQTGGGTAAIARLEVHGGRVLHGLERATYITVTDLVIRDGEFETQRVLVTNAYITGGRFIMSHTGANGPTLLTMGGGEVVYAQRQAFTITAVVQNGGVFYFDGPGTITAHTLNAGTLDMVRATGTTNLKTITTLTQDNKATLRYDTAYCLLSTWNRNGPFENYGIGE